MVTPRFHPLDKKMLRDLWRMKWQALAIACLIATGISVTVMAYGALEALRTARDVYYRESRFADLFVSLKRAPLGITERIAQLDGVVAVEPRILFGGLSTITGLKRPATLQMVSLPDDASGGLNRVVITRGRAPASGRTNEALVLQTFLDASGLKLGDRIRVTAAGRVMTFTLVGAALSPEFTYLPSPSSVMPDDAHTGILWVHRTTLEAATNLDGAFNNVSLKLAVGASSPAIEQQLNALLSPYGVRPITPRDDQPSHAFLEGELQELQRSGLIFPPIFILVAAGLVHMIMLRLIEMQREQIGLLKAFGYTDAQAARPYAILALTIGLVGILLGAGIGAILARAITRLYGQYMHFPTLEPRFHLTAFLVASAAALIAILAGALYAVRSAARLSPAIAMSPPAPARYRKSVLEATPLARGLTIPWRLMIRNIERRPVRAGLTIVGLAASVALLLSTQFVFSAMNTVIEHTFFRRQNMSHWITFVEPRDARAMLEVQRIPGVMLASPVRSVDVTLMNGAQDERVALVGLDRKGAMLHLLDHRNRSIPFRGDGLVLTDALAKKLNLSLGAPVRVRVHEGVQRDIILPVSAFAQEFSGLSAYIDRSSLNQLLYESNVASGAHVTVDPSRTDLFYRVITETPGIAGAISRDATVQTYRRLIEEAFRTSRLYYAGFAALIAFGVAYNAGRIAFSERARDLATLEVLGFTHGEIARIQLGEHVLLSIVAIPIGLGLGWAMVHAIAAAYQRDEMRIPPVIDSTALTTTLLVYSATIALTLALIAYRLWRLDLVVVLKTRE